MKTEEEIKRDNFLEELKDKPLLETTAEDLLAMSRKNVKRFIRKSLAYEARHYIFSEDYLKFHKRFNMSGYDGGKGTATRDVFEILDIFSYLGIYDYTSYLVLDFYKGNAQIYLNYWGDDELQAIELDNLGTTDIIYDIFKRTIFSGKTKRRR